MKDQNFENHSMFVPLFHGVTAAVILLGLVGAIIDFVRAYGHGEGRLTAALLIILFITAVLLFWFVRSFALGAQDRAIRAEENLRYYSMAGKLLDSRLRLSQIIALRFAPNDEFIELADRAVQENLRPTDIKKAIKNWKADHHRI